ncbi:hypothetical protein [Streptomyces sp. NPDC088757]
MAVDAAVVPVPDPVGLRAPKAFVVPAPGRRERGAGDLEFRIDPPPAD